MTDAIPIPVGRTVTFRRDGSRLILTVDLGDDYAAALLEHDLVEQAKRTGEFRLVIEMPDCGITAERPKA